MGEHQVRTESSELQERLRVILESGALGMWEVDLRSGEVLWSARGDQFLGIPNDHQPATLDELLSFVHSEDAGRVKLALQEALATKLTHRQDRFRIVRRDGSIRHISIYVHFLWTSEGMPDRMIGISLDVTDVAEFDQRLRENEEQLRLAYDAVKVWTWQIDLHDWTITRSTGGRENSPHFTRREKFSEWLLRVHSDDRERVKRSLTEAIESGLPWTEEFRLRWPSGEYRWIYDRGQKIIRSDGDAIFAGAALDVGEKKFVEEKLLESERLRLLAVEAAEMGVFVQNMQTGEVHWSDRQFELYGIDRAEFRGRRDDFRALVFPEDLAQMQKEHLRLVAARARRFHFEFRIRRPKDGQVRWIASDGEITYDENAKALTMMGVNFDITTRKEQDRQLRESEQLRRIALSSAEMGIWRQNLQTSEVQWTERQFELFGISPEAFDGKWQTAFSNVLPEDRKRVQHEFEQLLKQHATRHLTEFRVRTQDGNIRWVAGVGEIVYDDKGLPIHTIGVNFDITQRKQQEAALRESERLRRLALGAAQMGAWEWDFHARRLRWSDEQLRLFGLDENKFDENLESFHALVHPDDLPHLLAYERKLLRDGQRRYKAEFRIRLEDGTERWIRALGEVEYGDDSRPLRMFGVNWDFTESKQAEQQIMELNRKLVERINDFEALMRAIPVAVAIGTNAESTDIRPNPTFAQMLGLKQSNVNISKNSPDGQKIPYRLLREGKDIPPQDLPPEKAARLKSDVRDQELELVSVDGRHYQLYGHAVPMLDENGNVRGTVTAYMDVTARKKAEDAMRTSEKLAAAGKIAATLAHEINNPLAAVTNLLYLIKQDSGLDDNSRRFVEMASAELARVSHITRNILAFYRDSSSPVRVDIGELSESVVDLYTPKIRQSNIEVSIEREKGTTALVYPGEIRQVISNFVVNAVEAMPNGGRLRVRVRPLTNHSGQKGVRVIISDTGVGIPDPLKSRLFEPFFTTKGEKGTGLGLWVCRDIISKHRGRLQFRSSSKDGRSGTCFSIFLPADGGAALQQPSAATSSG